jgi:hypothetical protein
MQQGRQQAPELINVLDILTPTAAASEARTSQFMIINYLKHLK